MTEDRAKKILDIYADDMEEDSSGDFRELYEDYADKHAEYTISPEELAQLDASTADDQQPSRPRQPPSGEASISPEELAELEGALSDSILSGEEADQIKPFTIVKDELA